QLDGGVLGAAADVGLLLLLGHVDGEVAATAVEPGHHPLVDRGPRPDERLAALLKRVQPVGHGDARLAGGQHPVSSPARDRLPRLPADQAGRHHPGAPGQGQDAPAHPDQRPCRRVVDETNPAPGVGAHGLQLAAPRPQGLSDRAHLVLMDVDGALLDRLQPLPVVLANDHLGTRHLELVPLTPPRLHQPREAPLAAAALSTSTRCRPSQASMPLIWYRWLQPAAVPRTTDWPLRIRPRTTRPSARRPRYGSSSRALTMTCSGASGSPDGAGTCSRMAS